MDGTKHKRMPWMHIHYMGNVRAESRLLLKQCVCIRYKSIKSQWSDLTKFTFLQSLPVATPLPRHFDTKGFTIVALDSSGNADRNNLSGRKHARDIVITAF